MGFIPSLLGIGNTGMNFQAQAAPVQQPISAQQAQQLYGQTQQGLAQQQQFTQALQAQNGIGNQSQVFQQQQGLANQLGQEAQGQGPNPAMAQLAQTTGQNVQQQAAMQAGQRGSSANAGLMARQIGQQGANLQQQAVGQGAVMSANQQLAAQQALQQQQAMMGNLAGAQVVQQGQALGNYNNTAGNLLGQGLQSIQGVNQSNVGMQSNENSVNGGIANTVAGFQNQAGQGVAGMLGKTLGLGGGGTGAGAGAGGLAGAAGLIANKGGMASEEGMITGMSHGGGVKIPSVMHYRTEGQHTAGVYNEGGPVSFIGKHFQKMATGGLPAMSGEYFAKGGKPLPGRAAVQGDSEKNDTIPALLSPGEIIVPRTKAQDPQKAASFAKSVAMRAKSKKR